MWEQAAKAGDTPETNLWLGGATAAALWNVHGPVSHSTSQRVVDTVQSVSESKCFSTEHAVGNLGGPLADRLGQHPPASRYATYTASTILTHPPHSCWGVGRRPVRGCGHPHHRPPRRRPSSRGSSRRHGARGARQGGLIQPERSRGAVMWAGGRWCARSRQRRWRRWQRTRRTTPPLAPAHT